jgi:hypothetical protein
MEELDANAQQRREVFARYGLAMYHAQCVEKGLAILVSSVFNKQFLPADYEQRGKIQEEMLAKTIGRLLNHLKKQVSVPPNLGRTLNEALQKRNWLAHDYFYERAGQIMTTRGRDKMIKELIELSNFFSRLDAHLSSIYEKWCKKVGVSQASIDENMRKLISEHE